jgi:hypothetical protein
VVPERVIVSGEVAALVVTTTLPENGPASGGEYETDMEQDMVGARLAGQLLVAENATIWVMVGIGALDIDVAPKLPNPTEKSAGAALNTGSNGDSLGWSLKSDGVFSDGSFATLSRALNVVDGAAPPDGVVRLKRLPQALACPAVPPPEFTQEDMMLARVSISATGTTKPSGTSAAPQTRTEEKHAESVGIDSAAKSAPLH